MLSLTDSVNEIKGVGEKTALLLKKLHIDTVEDLLFHLPRGFEEIKAAIFPSKEMDGNAVSIKARLVAGSIISKRTGKYIMTTAKVIAENTVIQLRFFNMPYLKNLIKPGVTYVFSGILSVRINRKTDEIFYSLLQPKIQEESKYQEQIGCLMPIYPLTKGLSNKMIQKACSYSLKNIEEIKDVIPIEARKDMNLMSLMDAFINIHLPKSMEDYKKARKRLAFQEFFIFLYQMKRTKVQTISASIKNPLLPVAETDRLIELLPFRLTNEQIKVWKEIEQDLEATSPMNRLLQGDVGSGKTILAFLTILKACANGRQACLMAPTEVLAEQHFRSISELCKKLKLCMKPVLLLGSMTAKQKRLAKEGIADGSYNVIIGTHAVIQNDIQYKNLSVAITDEQHRFGVNQRESLRDKGDYVHVLVMSATPIPRTLALILYGDLSISTIRELPSNRLPIKNCVVDDGYREKAYSFMNKEVSNGRQVYIICPMVEASENTEELENVIEYSEKIRPYFESHIRISYLHGKMSYKEKEEIMNEFADGLIDILVSTTVIEVGINVPNASVMMIENAERYGLAQLHQLRGRVGRGEHQSYCIFMSNHPSKKNKERLEILNYSNDGFEIANKDLELRGPGQLGGIRQSGDLGFAVADIYEDQEQLIMASQFCQQLNNGYYNDEEIRCEFQHFHFMTDKMDTL